jgi:hypothetical protein
MSLTKIETTTIEMMALLEELATANTAVCPLVADMRTEMNALQPLLGSSQFCVDRCANILCATLDRAVIVSRYISRYKSTFGYNNALDSGMDSIASEVKLLRTKIGK